MVKTCVVCEEFVYVEDGDGKVECRCKALDKQLWGNQETPFTNPPVIKKCSQFKPRTGRLWQGE